MTVLCWRFPNLQQGQSEVTLKLPICMRSQLVMGWCLSSLQVGHQRSDTNVPIGRGPGTDARLISSGLPVGFGKNFWVLESSFRPSCFPPQLSLLFFLPPFCLPVYTVSGDSDLKSISLLSLHSFKGKSSKRKIETPEGHQGCFVPCLSQEGSAV